MSEQTDVTGEKNGKEILDVTAEAIVMSSISFLKLLNLNQACQPQHVITTRLICEEFGMRFRRKD